MLSDETKVGSSSGAGGPVARPAPGSMLRVLLAWAVVTIPALWGIAMTIRTSTKLFAAPAAQTSAAPQTAPAAR